MTLDGCVKVGLLLRKLEGEDGGTRPERGRDDLAFSGTSS